MEKHNDKSSVMMNLKKREDNRSEPAFSVLSSHDNSKIVNER